MPTFAYEVLREPGDAVRGEVEAEDPRAAAALLLAKGYHILRIDDTDAAGRRGARLRVGLFGGLRHASLVRFTRDLASLLRAGLPLASAIEKLRTQTDHPGWRSVLAGIKARIEDGHAFSQALAAYPGVFNSTYVHLVNAGEESGKLVGALTRLADLGEKSDELRGRLRMALIYPAAMLAIGCVTVFILVSFVVPMFVQVFRESGQSLPLPTAILVAISAFLGKWWWAVIACVVPTSVAIVRYLRTDPGKHVLDTFLLRLPLARRVVSKSQVAAFAQTLSNLLESGIPAVNALAVTADTLGNSVYGRAIRGMAAAVREGQPISRAGEATGLLPPLVTSAIAVGEESGELPAILGEVAAETVKELDREVRVVMTLLEPLLIVLLGGVVGFIVMAMVLPIFELGNSIQM